jgi:hypothetical protein
MAGPSSSRKRPDPVHAGRSPDARSPQGPPRPPRPHRRRPEIDLARLGERVLHGVDRDVVQAAARRQFDVVSRAQLIRLGADAGWISRQIASERWQRLFPGTYVVHTGSTTWRTRASAALLYAGPGAALSHRSAGFLLDVVPTPGPDLDISVPHQRRVAAQPGLIVHRRRSMPPTVGRPTCTHPAHTVLDLVDTTGSVDEVVRLLCAAARARIWPAVITEAAEARPRLRNRSLVRGLLGEVADGVESPLEHRYIRDVERRHGLPRARLQARDRVGGVWIRSDALYVGLGVRTELDGALAHPDGSDRFRHLAGQRGPRRAERHHLALSLAPCRRDALRRGGTGGRCASRSRLAKSRPRLWAGLPGRPEVPLNLSHAITPGLRAGCAIRAIRGPRRLRSARLPGAPCRLGTLRDTGSSAVPAQTPSRATSGAPSAHRRPPSPVRPG